MKSTYNNPIQNCSLFFIIVVLISVIATISSSSLSKSVKNKMGENSNIKSYIKNMKFDSNKVMHSGWLRKADKIVFLTIPNISDLERNEINPFEKNKDFDTENNFDIPQINMFFFELKQKDALVMYNSNALNKIRINQYEFSNVELLKEVSFLSNFYHF